MSKLFSRIGQSKTPMAISLQFLEVSSETETTDEFNICWRRGPQEDETAKYQFEPGQKILKMTDKFDRISGFYQNKKGEFQRKTCAFRLRIGGKSHLSNFDLSSQVGNKNTSVEITLGKLTVKVLFKIVPASRVTHAELFASVTLDASIGSNASIEESDYKEV